MSTVVNIKAGDPFDVYIGRQRGPRSFARKCGGEGGA
jgi:hypothetical protein